MAEERTDTTVRSVLVNLGNMTAQVYFQRQGKSGATITGDVTVPLKSTADSIAELIQRGHDAL